MTIDVDAHTIATLFHLLGVCVWIGGQLLMAALVGVLRQVTPEAPALAARRFGQLAWPAYAIAVVTGVWLVWLVDITDADTTYQAVIGIKLLLVAGSGVAAFLHANANAVAVRAVTGAGALVTGLGALFCGVLLVT